MKAIHGALDISKKYTLVGCEYHGKYSGDDAGLGMVGTCENCGIVITNVAIVKSEDGIEYRIGLDCMETLTNMIPSEALEAKKTIRRRIKFCKFMATECKLVVISHIKTESGDYDYYDAYNYPKVSTIHRFWNGYYSDKNKALIEKYNIPLAYNLEYQKAVK
jgi:hypothetical protein